MNYEGIKGESADQNHKDWLDIDNFKFGIARKITSATSTQGDRESANAVIQDLKIQRKMDKSTPKLFIESCCGTGKTVKIVQTKSGTGKGADAFIEYTLKNALISHYDVEALGQSGSRPREELTISFVDIEVKYIPYDEDGNPEAPISVGFNTATNTKK